MVVTFITRDFPSLLTVTYTETEGGMINVTVDGTDKDGNAVHWTLQCKLDGKPYKVQGNPLIDTITYKKVNDHTNYMIFVAPGKNFDLVSLSFQVPI
jgi:hypothetical protein